MNQLKTTISKSTNLFRLNPNQALPILQTHHFCSATPATEQPPDQSSQVDPFLRSSNQSIVYGRLTGNGPYTMKTDIIHMLEGCDLSLQDVRVEYNRYYDPVAMIVQFPSRPSFDFAVKAVVRQGRVYRLEKTDKSYWNIPSYDGKTVLLQGLPRNALPEDVDRFLCGSECFTSTMQMFTRQGLSNPIKMALVQFPSQIEAMNSVISKNRSFCLNNQILMRVLHKTLRAFREGEVQVLVASDAMTRGMDVEGVRNVINYDLPPYIKTYIHRAGRTARAGQAGRCFTLLRSHEVKQFNKMLQKADNESCSTHPLPADSIELLRPLYISALEKLKKCTESENLKRRTSSFKLSRTLKVKKPTNQKK